MFWIGVEYVLDIDLLASLKLCAGGTFGLLTMLFANFDWMIGAPRFTDFRFLIHILGDFFCIVSAAKVVCIFGEQLIKSLL